ncbi:MAG: nucleotidyltransferase domain-containing protein [Oscillospiraceae bacterium]|nr:nucleotidyltransferase domain-containing protein [Oscillospiraceae bacterium]
MNILVPKKLHEIEKEYNVTILLAVESGSRAWGFASPDSDFDVRFIYKRPKNEYLKLNTDHDVIELPVDDTWDVNGWDLDKTLKLLFKSNPTLFEWINSPLCYYKTDFTDKIKPVLNEYFSVKNTVYHYLNTARNNMKIYLSGEKIHPKKYFYALRPVLACLWVLEHQTPPPVLFSELTKTMLPDNLLPSLDYLLDIKMNNPEKAEIAPVRDIDEFLRQHIEEIDKVMESLQRREYKSWDLLNEFFINEIAQ